MPDDVLTIIMGLDGPMEPGMHGPLKEPCPTDDAVGLVTKIRDTCDKWLRSAGKEDAGTTSQQDGVTEDGGEDGEE